MAASFSNSCNAGSADLSPFWALSARASSSSCPFGPACGCVSVLLTSFSPFAALVLVVAGGQQRGAGSLVYLVPHSLQITVESCQLLFVLLLLQCFQSP